MADIQDRDNVMKLDIQREVLFMSNKLGKTTIRIL